MMEKTKDHDRKGPICQGVGHNGTDEPTSYLDIRFTVDLLNILTKLSLNKKKP